MHEEFPTIAEASRALTPVARNIEEQGPGGQAMELAPTAAAAARRDTPMPLTSKLAKKAEKWLEKAGRGAAEAGAKIVVGPFLKRPVLACGVLGAASVSLLVLWARRAARD